MRELSTSEINREIAMMQDPDRWPSWPYLALKRYSSGNSGDYETAYLYDIGVNEKGHGFNDDVDLVMRMGNIWQPKKDDPEVKFESFTELVKQGWLVD